MKWTKAMLKARIKQLELEVAEWKKTAEINQDLLIMERVSIQYGRSKEFRKVQNK